MAGAAGVSAVRLRGVRRGVAGPAPPSIGESGVCAPDCGVGGGVVASLILVRAGVFRAVAVRVVVVRAGALRAGVLRAGVFRAGVLRAGA